MSELALLPLHQLVREEGELHWLPKKFNGAMVWVASKQVLLPDAVGVVVGVVVVPLPP